MTTSRGKRFAYTNAAGEVVSRTSTTMTYTHVVLVRGRGADLHPERGVGLRPIRRRL